MKKMHAGKEGRLNEKDAKRVKNGKADMCKKNKRTHRTSPACIKFKKGTVTSDNKNNVK